MYRCEHHFETLSKLHPGKRFSLSTRVMNVLCSYSVLVMQASSCSHNARSCGDESMLATVATARRASSIYGAISLRTLSSLAKSEASTFVPAVRSCGTFINRIPKAQNQGKRYDLHRRPSGLPSTDQNLETEGNILAKSGSCNI